MRWLAFLTALLVLCGGESRASVLVPAGLNPGDTYQLVFVTRGTHDANDFGAAPYHSFVRTEAALNPSLTGTNEGVTYRAMVAAFNDQNVLANAPIVGPVYNFNGDLVAANQRDMYDGNLSAPIRYDQFGNRGVNFGVYTGYLADGSPDRVLRDGLGVGVGDSNRTDSRWALRGIGDEDGSRAFYGLSSVLTVPPPPPDPDPIPEPTTFVIWSLLAMLGIGAYRRRRRRA